MAHSVVAAVPPEFELPAHVCPDGQWTTALTANTTDCVVAADLSRPAQG